MSRMIDEHHDRDGEEIDGGEFLEDLDLRSLEILILVLPEDIPEGETQKLKEEERIGNGNDIYRGLGCEDKDLRHQPTICLELGKMILQTQGFDIPPPATRTLIFTKP